MAGEEPPDDPEMGFESGTPEEWLEKLAESEGLSRDEVVERLLSSYWTLREMYGIMGQAEGPPDDELDPLDLGEISAEPLTEDIEELSRRLDDLEEAIHGVDPDASPEVLRAEMDALDRRVDDVEETLTDHVESLRLRFDREFENLETILDYLIEQTDDLDARVASLSTERRAARRRRREQERLAELKQLASRLDVRTATCEFCDDSVDIAMLTSPACPQCDRRIVDIHPSTGWFGLGSHVLSVTRDSPAEESRPDLAGSADTDPRVDSTDAPEDEQPPEPDDPDGGVGDGFDIEGVDLGDEAFDLDDDFEFENAFDAEMDDADPETGDDGDDGDDAPDRDERGPADG